MEIINMIAELKKSLKRMEDKVEVFTEKEKQKGKYKIRKKRN